MMLATTLLLMASCDGERLSASWAIDRTRILAVRAEVLDEDGNTTTRAEARPGETVSLHSLTVHPDQSIAGVFWLGCLLEDSSQFGCNINEDLLSDLDGLDPETMSPEEMQAFFDALAEAGFLGIEPDFPPQLRVPADVLDDLEGDDLLEGKSYMLTLSAMPADEEGTPDESDLEIAYKRIVVSEAATPNHNPYIQSLLIDGSPHSAGEEMTYEAESVYAIDPVLTSDSVETFVYLNSDGVEENRVEEPYFNFYATEGYFDSPYSLPSHSSVTWNSPVEPSGQTIRIWVVVRDRRGGMGWFEQVMNPG